MRLGAAGAIEAALLWLTLVDNPQGQAAAALVGRRGRSGLAAAAAGGARRRAGAGAALMSNSFAFGGSNGVLLLDRAEHDGDSADD